MHYGLHDDSGSEHSVNDYAFPAEVSHSVSQSFVQFVRGAGEE